MAFEQVLGDLQREDVIDANKIKMAKLANERINLVIWVKLRINEQNIPRNMLEIININHNERFLKLRLIFWFFFQSSSSYTL